MISGNEYETEQKALGMMNRLTSRPSSSDLMTSFAEVHPLSYTVPQDFGGVSYPKISAIAHHAGKYVVIQVLISCIIMSMRHCTGPYQQLIPPLSRLCPPSYRQLLKQIKFTAGPSH